MIINLVVVIMTMNLYFQQGSFIMIILKKIKLKPRKIEWQERPEAVPSVSLGIAGSARLSRKAAVLGGIWYPRCTPRLQATTTMITMITRISEQTTVDHGLRLSNASQHKDSGEQAITSQDKT